MVRSGNSLPYAVFVAILGLGCIAAPSILAQAEAIPSSTAIPVIFTHTLQAGVAKPGEIVTAKTTQSVLLPGGKALPLGTVLTGHVVQSTPFVFDPTPYAVQKPSVLSVHFDTIAEGGTTIPVNLSVRAITGPVAAHEASIPHYRDETDSTGIRTLIGGSQVSPLGSTVTSPSGDIVGYSRKQGVFARLIANDYTVGDSVGRCDATESEQSVGIFSADACGVYELDTASLSHNGSSGDGIFVLTSTHNTVKLHSMSAALLQAVGA
jgi:hypothetical protein